MDNFKTFALLAALALLLIDKVAFAIKCYECSVHPKRNGNNTSFETVCTKFDESERFEVECPFSTMCKKRVYRYQLINTVQESIERGCADQRNDSMNYVTGKWVKVQTVDEPYTEGCTINKDDGSEYCHCRGDLCNSALNTLSNGVDAMGVLIVFNLVKYFRNMDYY